MKEAPTPTDKVFNLTTQSREAQDQQPPTPFKPRNILGDGVLSTLKASVFLLTDNNLQNGQPIGVGFCVGGKNKAITAHHNLPAGYKVGSHVKGFFGPPYFGNSLDMSITYTSTKLDLVVLEITHSTFAYQSLQLYPSAPEERSECVLAAFHLSLVEQLHPDVTTTHSLVLIRGSLIKVHTYHLVYECPAFSGDSGGGALIFSDGAVIGMHTETVNQALERLGRASSLTNRLDDVEHSLDSMIKGLSSGCVGVQAALFAKLV